MSSTERKIKDLSIALEALSRVGGRCAVSCYMDQIEEGLVKYLSDMKDDWKPLPIAKSTTARDFGDDIPF